MMSKRNDPRPVSCLLPQLLICLGSPNSLRVSVFAQLHYHDEVLECTDYQLISILTWGKFPLSKTPNTFIYNYLQNLPFQL